MQNLPKKKQILPVQSEDYEGVTMRLRTANAERIFKMMDDVGLTLDDVASGVAEVGPSSASHLIRLFRERIVGIDGLQIEGEPFNPEDDEHMASLPVEMMMEGAAELITYPFITEAMGKDSAEPEPHSPKASTQPVPSATVSQGSS